MGAKWQPWVGNRSCSVKLVTKAVCEKTGATSITVTLVVFSVVLQQA